METTAISTWASILPVNINSFLGPSDRDIGQGQKLIQSLIFFLALLFFYFRSHSILKSLAGCSSTAGLKVLRKVDTLSVSSSLSGLVAWLGCFPGVGWPCLLRLVWRAFGSFAFWSDYLGGRFSFPFHEIPIPFFRARSSLSAQHPTLPLIGSV